jgi:hypothetical protein
MTTWTKVVLRIAAALNFGLAFSGSFLLVRSVNGFVARVLPQPNFPHLRVAFAGMVLINTIFLIAFVVTAVLLFRLSKVGIMMHAITCAALIAYFLLIVSFWVIGGSFGLNIAAATGIGNAGISPFTTLPFAHPMVMPYLYPIASTLVLLGVRRTICRANYPSKTITAV